jgi:hypothetical protein
MSDDDELKLVAEIERAIGKPSHVDMNEAFSARMRAAIEAGLESASIGIVTTPGTQKPKYVGRGNLPFSAQGTAVSPFSFSLRFCVPMELNGASGSDVGRSPSQSSRIMTG